MLSLRTAAPRHLTSHVAVSRQLRNYAAQAQAKKEGDISSVFVSLSGIANDPLPQRFATMKQELIRNHESALTSSFHEILSLLPTEVAKIHKAGPDIIPSLQYTDINNPAATKPFFSELKNRGVAVIRGVVPEEEALGYKQDIKDYVVANPHTKAFPKDDPQVFELYWSPSQIRARAHPNLLAAQKFLLRSWNSVDKDADIDLGVPLAYADRLRIRQPGDSGFALGPHVDGGSVERWEPHGYGLGHTYDSIFEGRWHDYDPWEASTRLAAVSDNYNGAGACTMFRMYQGWLSMSTTAPYEGTLLVNPMLKLATSYWLLRPFFSPINADKSRSGYLDKENWVLNESQNSDLHGAFPSCAQELNDDTHPHLDLAKSMVHVPRVSPGDYVVWHCDTIHAVDKLHAGKGDSSVMYIPTCPLTELNAGYLVRQREAFLEGTPGPDFPGGKGESGNVGRVMQDEIERVGGVEALQAMGFGRFESGFGKKANSILGL